MSEPSDPSHPSEPSDPARAAEELFAKFPGLRDQLDAMVSGQALVAPAPPLTLRPTIVTRLGLLPVFGIPFGFAVAASLPVAVGIAAGYAAAWAGIARRRIIVDDHGVERRGTLGERRLRWDDVAYYTYWAALPTSNFTAAGTVHEWRVVDSPAASVSRTHHRLRLYDAAGRRLQIDSYFRGAERAVGRILGELHRRLTARPDDFAPYAITDAGLAHEGNGVLPWAELEMVVVNDALPTELRIMKHRKILPWSVRSLDRIHNGMLLLERLAERGVVIDPGRRAFLTRPVLATLARAKELPRAEVVRR